LWRYLLNCRPKFVSNNDIFTDSGPELQPLIGPLFTFFPNQYFVHLQL
jgi:hypothetical protein